MKKILVVGFGAMGCRHVQSLLNDTESYIIEVLELSQDNRSTNCQRIGAEPDKLIWHESLDTVKSDIDLAIIATSSEPRYSITKALLNKGIKYFLLEKIVFQSLSQFDDIISLATKSGAKLYCNFVNRYFDVYRQIKKVALSSGNLKMTVFGNEFGLGCNAIHYIDLFQFITGSDDPNILNKYLHLSHGSVRRGSQYREFTGTMAIRNQSGDELTIASTVGFEGGVVLNISVNGNLFLLSEQTQTCILITDDSIQNIKFDIVPTSKLTRIIVKEIFDGTTVLPDLEKTRKAHAELFRSFNEALQKDPNDLCPIT